MDIPKAFAAAEKRAHKLRLTAKQLVAAAQVNRVSYWRAKTGKNLRDDTSIVILAKVETALDQLEASR